MSAARAGDVAVFALPAAVLLALLALPLVALSGQALGGGVGPQLGDPTVVAAVRLSLVTSTLSSLVVVVLGTPLAYVLVRWRFPGRTLVQLVVDLPVVLPPMVAGIALLQVFGRRGWLGDAMAAAGVFLPFTTAAVVVAQVFVAGPFYVRAARLGFAGVDPAVREAARVDGASELQLFGHIMVPVARKAMLGGLVLAWARALGEFGATIFFAGNREGVTQTMPLAIFVGFESDLTVAVGLSFLLLVVSVGVLAAVWLLGDRPGE